MYSDKKKKHTFWIWIVLALAAIFVLVYTFAGHSGEDLTEESAAAIQEAVRRSAMQCYVVEGVYPENLSYLEKTTDCRSIPGTSMWYTMHLLPISPRISGCGRNKESTERNGL